MCSSLRQSGFCVHGFSPFLKANTPTRGGADEAAPSARAHAGCTAIATPTGFFDGAGAPRAAPGCARRSSHPAAAPPPRARPWRGCCRQRDRGSGPVRGAGGGPGVRGGARVCHCTLPAVCLTRRRFPVADRSRSPSLPPPARSTSAQGSADTSTERGGGGRGRGRREQSSPPSPAPEQYQSNPPHAIQAILHSLPTPRAHRQAPAGT